jgi:hypothetical protein
MMAGLAKQLILDIMKDPVHHQHHVRVYVFHLGFYQVCLQVGQAMPPLLSRFLHMAFSQADPTIRISGPLTNASLTLARTYDRGIGWLIIGQSLGMKIPPIIYSFGLSYIYRYIPRYLKELQDGHLKELGLFKRKLLEVKDRLVCLAIFLVIPSFTYDMLGTWGRNSELLWQVCPRAPRRS